jgi:hypothetical protein
MEYQDLPAAARSSIAQETSSADIGARLFAHSCRARYDEEGKKREKKKKKSQLCERKEGSGTQELPHTTSPRNPQRTL